MLEQSTECNITNAYMIPSPYWDIFSKCPGGVSIATDPLCTTILHNRKAARMLRVSEGEDFSHSSTTPPQVSVYRNRIVISPDEMPMQRTARHKIEVLNEVLELVWEDGHRMISVWNTSPILDEAGEVLGVLATSEDITEFVLQERQMKADKEYLESLVAERNEEQLKLRSELERLDRLSLVAQMAASISHEVRNPIATVRGFLQLMNSLQPTGQLSPHYDLIISELDRANAIIGNFLSLSKSPTDDREMSGLLDVFMVVMPLLEADALMRGKRLTFEQQAVSHVCMNKKEIQQVLINLVRNGLEASPVGAEIRVELFDNSHTVGFTVQDEGEGMPPSVLERLGTPFFTTKGSGTGLGLSICYEIISRHGADIKVESNSSGTTFTVAFPKCHAAQIN
ncbi:hypothetical protein PCCS19_38400 [Paenibacillus sp. CCS19]|uniref:ATP-binding protein n=1 Tax=Paenibacillus sp. CCS19 TaxID=3158387 RepID=UPI00256380AD|nr:ATP-binding protein [Paenibacillus cellulosilyticus]GMK40784.1 hypothetical protein PCCS19_38400 [Paenibacillus cellulosilyticus]